MKLCVVIPAYNAANIIGGLIKSVRAYVDDVVVINDGSLDDTEKHAKDAGAYALSFKNNAGKGIALRAGLNYALEKKYDAVITMDADGQHLPKDILNIIDRAVSPSIDIVVGNRMANPEDMPFSRFVTNLFMSLIISAICRQNIPDTQCGFRLIKCNVLKKIQLTSARFEIESEILIKASRVGAKIRSTPVKSIYENHPSSINPFLDTWRFLVMLFKVFR